MPRSQALTSCGAFDLIAILIVMAAVFSYINLKVLKLPDAIGLMALTLLFSMAVFSGRLSFLVAQIAVFTTLPPEAIGVANMLESIETSGMDPS